MFKIKYLRISPILAITNVITAAVLFAILFKAGYIHIGNEPYSYASNINYAEQTDIYALYTGQKDIVMLGNSLTQKANWSELLSRSDVANRGIGGDITEGFIKRINFVLKLKPKICFIEGGLNDIVQGVELDQTLINYATLINTLNRHGVKPVIVLVPYVSMARKGGNKINSKALRLNRELVTLAGSRSVQTIDLNAYISDANGFRKPDFASRDGVHFNAKAYEVWRKEIVKYLP